MYDVYLFTGVSTGAVLAELVFSVPELNNSALQERIQRPAPGFLQLDLDAERVVSLLRGLRAAKAVGYIVPAAYRQPEISVEQALPLAEAALAELKAMHYPDHPVVPGQFAREEPVCWTFSATYRRNKRLYARVDKRDGHIWQQSDFKQIWEEDFFFREKDRTSRLLSIVPLPENAQEQTYDVYLIRGANKLPDLTDLMSEAPCLQEPALQQRLLQHATNVLNVELPKKGAIHLLQLLQEEDAKGSLLPTAYRRPKISVEQALPLAEQAITKLQETRQPGDTLGPVHFLREYPTCWTFGVVSEQLIKNGVIPGMFHASVDKLDGHIWQPEEFDRLAGESAF